MPQLRSLLLMWVLFAQQSWAQSAEQVYLDRMSHSFRELDYRGVFTYEVGQRMESLRIIHVVRDGIEQERLFHLDGDPVEYVRDGHDLSCVHPGHQKLRLNSGVLGGPFARSMFAVQGITDYYQLALGPLTRVADREARELAVQPNDPYRYGFRLYLDEQTGLLLKSLTVGPRGEILERFQFAEIEIGMPVDDELLAVLPAAARPVHHHLLEQQSAASTDTGPLPEPQWLPPGFTQGARVALPVESDAVLMYTDGFATFTLILEALDASPALVTDGRARQGATVAYIRHLTADEHHYVLTVVGEVPLMTARKIARSVQVKND